MAKTCLTHKDAPAVTMCAQCHKPICKSCVMVTPTGSFCSSECSTIHREMKGRLGGGKPAGTFTKKVILFVMLVMLAAIGFHFAARSNKDLRNYDVIGRLAGYPD